MSVDTFFDDFDEVLANLPDFVQLVMNMSGERLSQTRQLILSREFCKQ